MTKLKNWRIETTDNICRLTLDSPGARQNVLSGEVIAELDLALSEVEKSAPAGVIIRSAKAHGFIAGADIGAFRAIENEAQAKAMIATAHRVFDRLEALPMPTVAAINGHCLGGGLELALACDFRVACDDHSARLGLPEVRLGIHPGFGGSVRLCEAIGVLAAMDLMLSGRTISPSVAQRLRVVDYAVPLRQLERTAQYALTQKRTRRRRYNLLNFAPARAIIAAQLRKKVAAKVNPEHYPAPFQLIDLWREHGADRAAMLAAEQASVATLICTPTARNLVRVFFLREDLKRAGKDAANLITVPKTKRNAANMSARKTAAKSVAKSDKATTDFQHAHIIGGGVMGADITAWCALRGLRVTVHDQNPDALAGAVKRAHALFARKLKSPRLVRLAHDRFQPDLAGAGVHRADVVIEAIVEDAAAKIEVFAGVRKSARADALLATNTSSIPLATIADSFAKSADKKRLVGIHFFNPVARMQLVEIVHGAQTDAAAIRRAMAFTARIDRLPVAVKSAPGFLVNRILTPYLLEAVTLLREGESGAAIDRAATDFGMPIGPIELADTVGLDICLSVAQNLNCAVPDALQEKVAAQKLGKKSAEGFYEWRDGKPKKPAAKIDDEKQLQIRERLIFRYLNEAVACLNESIVATPNDLTAALIFATGFAPHLGGPIQYITSQGTKNLQQKLTELQEKHGERFKPSAGWEKLKLEE